MAEALTKEASTPVNLPVDTRAQQALAAQGAPAISELQEEVSGYADLQTLKVTDKETEQSVHDGYMTLKARRIEIQAQSKAAREDAVAYQKAVVSAEKELIAVIKPAEDALKNNRDNYRNEQKRIREEKNARQHNILDAIAELETRPGNCVGQESSAIAEMIEELESTDIPTLFEQWGDEGKQAIEKGREVKSESLQKMQSAFSQAKQAEEAQAALKKSTGLQKVSELTISGMSGNADQAQQAIRELKDFDTDDSDVETAVTGAIERVTTVLNEKLEALKAQQAQAEAEQKARDEENARLQAEKAEQEAKARAAQEANARLQREAEAAKEAETARIKAEQDAKEEAEAEKAEQERQEALRPDKEKLIVFLDQLKDFAANNAPELADEEAGQLKDYALQKVGEIVCAVKVKADEL